MIIRALRGVMRTVPRPPLMGGPESAPAAARDREATRALFALSAGSLFKSEMGEAVTLQVTEVKIRRLDNHGHVKAFASITFNGEFVVHDLRVIESSKGVFVAMPSRRDPSGAFHDVAHPISREMRLIIESAVLSELAMQDAEAAV